MPAKKNKERTLWDQIGKMFGKKMEKFSWGFHRISREQAQMIAELVYIPHQVNQWNACVRGEDTSNPRLNEERREVTLEEALHDALEGVGAAYDALILLFLKAVFTVIKNLQGFNTLPLGCGLGRAASLCYSHQESFDLSMEDVIENLKRQETDLIENEQRA